jgi:xylitol oxidase
LCGPGNLGAGEPYVEAALADFAPRPHWGKLHRLPSAEVVQRFPRLQDALGLARQHDPAGKFASDVL